MISTFIAMIRDNLDHLKMVFKHMKVINLKLNLGKCYFEEKEIIFLGHVVNQQGL